MAKMNWNRVRQEKMMAPYPAQPPLKDQQAAFDARMEAAAKRKAARAQRELAARQAKIARSQAGFLAKYEGWCVACRARISVGERITPSNRKKGYLHIACQGSTTSKERTPLADR